MAESIPIHSNHIPLITTAPLCQNCRQRFARCTRMYPEPKWLCRKCCPECQRARKLNLKVKA